MRKIFVTTDLHFNHESVMVRACGRPENYTELIVQKWQRVVRADDIVIVLGDVIMRRDGELRGLMARLPGRKWGVAGNHDRHGKDWYLDNGFDMFVDAIIDKGIYFTHIPAQELPPTCRMNICGHVHNNPLVNIQKYDLHVRFAAWHRVLSLEQMRYTPRPLTEVIDGRWHRTDVYPYSE